ncbi:MAG: glycosyltransferase family 4 protein [Deltaproteobacteria bacterium]|nr:glycosyltransferase family 4 protein [Deltaproteobacteria bacterium]MBW2071177.1 glycosyltransferase family 4 protein [Deltaproteobacteria bacterium]
MLIALDARSLLEPLTGVGYYSYYLFWHLLEQDKQNDYLLLGPAGLRRNLLKARLPREEKIHRLQQAAVGGFRKRSAYERLKLLMFYGPSAVFRIYHLRWRANLFFGPNFLGFFSANCTTVITVHDVSYLIYPDCIAEKTLRILRKHMPTHLARADHIIAVSQNTRKDLVRLCGVPEEKIAVIYPGYNAELFKPLPIENRVLSDKFNLKPGYILYVGTIEPRKNLITLLQAHRLLCRKGITVPLVFCGAIGWKSESFFNTLRSLESKDSVRLLGYVDEQSLPLLYNGAACFAFPSIYEGFGLPLVEAMACGCPVISSNVSAIPEVVGDAGLLIKDPLDQSMLADAIEQVIGDETRQQQMHLKGIERATRFSWRKTARETLKIFTELLGENETNSFDSYVH